jgi:drug/metabolite transporter (DMT)-like permease
VSAFIAMLVLSSALLHAGWNALLHGGRDRLFVTAVMGLSKGLAALVFVLMLPMPNSEAWPFIFGSAFFQILYSFFLVQAYQHGDLAEAYPIARGSSPLLIAVGALLFLNERLSPVAIGGIFLISVGIVALSFRGQQFRLYGTTMALLTGCSIAAYSVIDGIGVRLSGNPFSYIAWLELSWSIPLAIALLVWNRSSATASRFEIAKFAAGGIISLAAYGAVVWAFQFGPLGVISALRETSVLFALLLGHFFLGQPLTAVRTLACFVIVAGMALLGSHL